MQNVVFGHIHRIESAYAVALDGAQYVNFSCGWLGNQQVQNVFGYIKGSFQWQLGFGLVWANTQNGFFYHQIIPILENMTCVVNGKVYRP
jgi:hypothetical protein